MTVVPADTALIDLPPPLHRTLCLRLNTNDAWTSIADFLTDKGVNINTEWLRSLSNPAEGMLDELKIRLCDVGSLCNILESCQLYHALSVLKHPEPVRMLVQPGEGHDHMQVTYGGSLELECSAWSLPPPSYQWFRDNEQLAEETSNKLIIPDFSPDLEGRYYCKVQSSQSEVCSEEVDVTVAPIFPEVVEQPEGVTRQEGETVCLKCVIEAYPRPTYLWYKGNELLDKHVKSTLYINYARLEDSGVYRCIASNKAGEVVSEAVTVKIIKTDFPRLKLAERRTAKEKLALLIGNVKYKNHDHLVKPVDDVVLLAKKLTEVGFKVIALSNLSLVEMRNALRHFSNQLTPGVYGLFYFGGHGVQSDERLMLPVDAPKNYNPEHCLSEKEVKDVMLKKTPTLRVIILDMCLRAPDRPLQAVAPRPSLEEAAVDTPDINLILAYSTSGNLSAYERRSESNGTYMKYLSRFINEEIAIMGVFQKTHEAIYNETIKMKEVQEQQIPMLLSNVYKNFCFTDQVSGDSDIERFFSSIYLPPQSEYLDFNPSIKIEPRPKVSYFRHRECLLNAIAIEIKGIDLDTWQIKITSQKEILQMEDVPIQECREKDIFQVVIEDLQGPAAAGNLSLTVNLKDQQDCLIASTPIFLDKPMVAKLFLWFEPDDA